MTRSENSRCKYCAYWHETMCECRKLPPRVIPGATDGDGGIVTSETLWPCVVDSDWCGEWKEART